jgi:hypothetical protein
MKRQYDFSKAVRGKFFKPDARLNLPVYLEPDVQDFVQGVALRKQSDVSTVVNEILKSDMHLAEALR